MSDLPTGALRLLLTVHEAAEALRISERKLWQLTRDGEIVACRCGRRVLYTVHALEDYVARLQADARSGNPPACPAVPVRNARV